MLAFAKTGSSADGMGIHVHRAGTCVLGAFRPLYERRGGDRGEGVKMTTAPRANATSVGQGDAMGTIEKMLRGFSRTASPLNLGNAPAKKERKQ